MKRKDFPRIGETLYSETLENGLQIYVVPKPGFTESFAIYATRYGGADRRFRVDGRWIDTPAGVAHFLEHKMFDTPDGGNALTELSARGASPNAYTGSGMTAYHFSCTEGFEENLRTLLSFVSVPWFTPESVAKEQGIIGQEIRMTEDMPGYVVYTQLMRCLYAAHPIRDSVAGTVESIARITDRTLYDCHRVFYAPSNMVLCVAGDVDPVRVAEIAREVLPAQVGEVPARDYGPADAGVAPVQPEAVSRMAVSRPMFLLGSRLTPAPEGAERHRQQLAAGLGLRYFLGPSSPLYLRLYGEGLLDSDFGADVDYIAGTATFVCGGESRDPRAVARAICEAAEELGRTGPDEALFSRVKRASYGSRMRTLERFDSLCDALARDHFDGFSTLDDFALLEDITAGECAALLGELLRPEALALSLVLPID